MKIVEQFLVVADRCKIAFVLSVLQRILFFGQSIPINGTNQLLILLSQSLSEFLQFFLVHFENLTCL